MNQMKQKQISHTATIPAEMQNLRLDVAISQLFSDYSRSQLQGWIKSGFVTVNHHPETKPKKAVSAGDEISLNATLAETTDYVGQDIPLNIVYEDDYLLVVNKPVGLIVHPGAGNPDRTLVNALLHYAPALNTIPRAGVVHRLDKNTSGLLVVAKTLPMHNILIKAMQQRKIHREYRALVQGVMISGGTVNAPMGRHPNQRTKMAVTESETGRNAVTHYRVLSRFAAHTLLSVTLETGRTHQIRVHMAHIGYPIVGDKMYGRHRIYSQLSEETSIALRDFHHQALHASRLALKNPITKEEHEWIAPLPKDFEDLLGILSQK